MKSHHVWAFQILFGLLAILAILGCIAFGMMIAEKQLKPHGTYCRHFWWAGPSAESGEWDLEGTICANSPSAAIARQQVEEFVRCMDEGFMACTDRLEERCPE